MTWFQNMNPLASKLLILEPKQDELSSAKLSSLSWGWVELRLSWVEAELELKLSWDWAWQVFQLFNWSNWSLQLKYFKSCSILLLSRLGGWLCYLEIRLSQPQRWIWICVEAEGNRKVKRSSQIFWTQNSLEKKVKNIINNTLNPFLERKRWGQRAKSGIENFGKKHPLI